MSRSGKATQSEMRYSTLNKSQKELINLLLIGGENIERKLGVEIVLRKSNKVIENIYSTSFRSMMMKIQIATIGLDDDDKRKIAEIFAQILVHDLRDGGFIQKRSETVLEELLQDMGSSLRRDVLKENLNRSVFAKGKIIQDLINKSFHVQGDLFAKYLEARIINLVMRSNDDMTISHLKKMILCQFYHVMLSGKVRPIKDITEKLLLEDFDTMSRRVLDVMPDRSRWNPIMSWVKSDEVRNLESTYIKRNYLSRVGGASLVLLGTVALILFATENLSSIINADLDLYLLLYSSLSVTLGSTIIIMSEKNIVNRAKLGELNKAWERIAKEISGERTIIFKKASYPKSLSGKKKDHEQDDKDSAKSSEKDERYVEENEWNFVVNLVKESDPEEKKSVAKIKTHSKIPDLLSMVDPDMDLSAKSRGLYIDINGSKMRIHHIVGKKTMYIGILDHDMMSLSSGCQGDVTKVLQDAQLGVLSFGKDEQIAMNDGEVPKIRCGGKNKLRIPIKVYKIEAETSKALGFEAEIMTVLQIIGTELNHKQVAKYEYSDPEIYQIAEHSAYDKKKKASVHIQSASSLKAKAAAAEL